MFTFHKNPKKIQIIHVMRCVFGCVDIVLNILNVYCPLKIKEDTVNTFGCWYIVLNVYCPPKTKEDTANTRAVYSGAGTLFKCFKC